MVLAATGGGLAMIAELLLLGNLHNTGWNGPIAEALSFADRAGTNSRSDETDIAP